MPHFGCILLTTGRKPADLALALESLLRQRGVELDTVVVGNGWAPEGLTAGVRGIHEPVDRGIPAGRNAGVPHVRGDLIFFLDDDAALADDAALVRVAALFAADPALGMVQLRVEPRDPGGRRSRDWVPRLRSSDPWRSSDVTLVWEGAVAVRRDAFAQAGSWPSEFRFMHEGVALGWRMMDAGWRIRYAGDVVVHHPSPSGVSHEGWHWYGARNRVLLARRHLRFPLTWLYVGAFALRTAARLKSRRAAREIAHGYATGLRMPRGFRQPLKASTLWRMVRAGRPPIM
ncbi:MAG TPA: glycosyltransferase [Solirubrobacteraceae bacterium]